MISPLVIFVLIPTLFAGTVFMFVDGDLYYSETTGFTVARPSVEGHALATSDTGDIGIVVAGLDDRTTGNLVFERPETSETALAEIGGANSLLINREAANWLRVQDGDTVAVLVAYGDVTPMGVMPKTKRYRVAGVVDHYVYSSMPAVFLETEEARTLLGLLP